MPAMFERAGDDDEPKTPSFPSSQHHALSRRTAASVDEIPLAIDAALSPGRVVGPPIPEVLFIWRR